MRGLVLVCVLAGCNDPGLLLEIHASDGATIASVEVMIPDAVHGGGMGMPPKQSAKTPGRVYEVVDTTSADVSDGTAKVLLQAGSLDAVPALLVVGKDAGGAINGYALITDPTSSDGLIHVRHTASDEIVVHLDPIAQMPVAQARMPAQSERLARWSSAGDANDGTCIGILHADNKGDFFGPQGDTDCDAADPECDDTWFLRSFGAGRCASQMPPPSDDTMDACRIAATLGCTDGVVKDGDCTATPASICVPFTVCDQCTGLLDQGCLDEAVMDTRTSYIECTIYVDTGNGASTLCAASGDVGTIDLHGFIGDAASCGEVPGLIPDLASSLMPQATTPLLSTQGTLTFSCADQQPQKLAVTLTAASDQVDPMPMPTAGGLLFAIHGGTTAVSAHVLGLPFVARLQPIDGCPPEPKLTCTVVAGIDMDNTVVDEPMWHCAGN